MDCTQAQEAITAALDRTPVDAEYLAAAKEHCRTCPQCGAFVRAQLVVKQMPLPEPPSGLADRVMVAIHAEAEADARRAAVVTSPSHGASPADAAGAAAPLPEPSDEPRATLRAPARRRKPLGRVATAVALVGVAALMFVAAVSLAVFGSSQMNGRKAVTSSVYDSAAPSAPQATAGAGASGSAGSAAATEGAVVAANSASYVTLNGSVYVLTGPVSIDQSKLTVTGVTSTALSSGRTPIQRTVLVGTGPDTIYIADDSSQLLSFKRVTRQFRGATYQLTSAAIPAFGEWPSLPTQIPQPASADGSPAFVSAGKDTAGVSVYRLSTSSGASGIAIAPNTPAPDPAAGSPNWTWWAPAN